MKKILAIFLLIGLSNFAQAQRLPKSESLADQVASLPWQRGPVTASVAGQSHIYVPDGYMFLSPPASEQFLQLNGNPTQGDGDYILSPENQRWFSVFYFQKTGFVKDEKDITPEQQQKTLDALEAQTKLDNKIRKRNGWPSLTVLGWALKPQYDYSTKRLEWATILQSTDGQDDVNFNTRILGRYGVMGVDLVDNKNDIEKVIPTFNGLLDYFSFNPGNKYSDHQAYDKVAKYGLLGLIAGGAAAAVVKTGILAAIFAAIAGFSKAIIIFILAAFAAVARSIRSIFKKRKP